MFRAAALVLAMTLIPTMATAQDSTETSPRTITGGIYDKPFLFRSGDDFSIGGYIDIELNANENGSTFTAHRFVPFLYGQISDRVSVASEIEFEYGGVVAGDAETDGEIKVEFAQIDFRMAEWFQFRGGVLLSPLGRFNLNHDSPVNDLTERPLVDQQIIPTTLSEAGMGFFGTMEPGESSLLTWEAYLVNGFDEGILSTDGTGMPTGEVRIRRGRGSAKQDNNNARSFVGRLGYSPMLGLDLGVSAHTGRYTDQDHTSESLTITALDAHFNHGPLELLGEYAHSSTGLPEGVTLDESDNVGQNGFYFQTNVHFLTGVVASMPNSVLTGVVRFDQVDFDLNATGDRTRRLAIGLNFRPTEDTAFKLDVTRGWRANRGSDTDGLPSDSAHFSVASYF